VAECYYGELLSHGVRIFTYTPGFLHSKAILADREAVFVGSVNMDYRSFRLHFECGTLLFDHPVIENVLEDMDEIIALSEEVTLETWHRRPWYRKALSAFLRLFAIWM
jgi:cardiolipin synthase